MNQDLGALELLREELQGEETYLKVNAIHRLPVVCRVLGPELVKNHLLPYLNGQFQTGLLGEDEEVLFALARELIVLQPYLRGNITLLIPPLEALASMDETLVREEAVRSLASLAEAMSDNEVITLFAPLVVRLSEQDKFSSKMAASALVAAAYPRAGPLKEKLRGKFFELSHEETPMIRRVVAVQMAAIAQVVERDVLLGQLMTEFKQLAGDEQDAIRNVCIDALITLSSLLTREDNRLHTLPLAITAGEDKSWKVRIHFAEQFPALAEAFGREMTESSLIQTFVQLLRDTEADVRAMCLQSLQQTMRSLSPEKVQTLVFPHLSSMAQDTNANAHVRMHIADIAAEMATALGAAFTQSNLLSVVEDLLKDSNNEVKVHVALTLSKLGQVLGAEMPTTRFCTAVLALAKDSTCWRVREAVITQCAILGKQLGLDAFVQYLQPTFLLFLRDISTAVRKAGISHLSTLSTVLKGDWARSHLLPAMREVYNSTGYCHRISVLECLPAADLSLTDMLTFLTEAARSTVPNIRFNMCKVAKQLLAKQNSPEIRGLVQSLLSDSDGDVVYYAQAALRSN
jgi:serine/threonine-protein phosphatase 2A regulatory subunit A